MDKFVINKGIDNEFVITIKQDGTTLPMVIEPTDTFSATINKLSDNTVVATPSVSVADAPNGKIKLVFTADSTSVLERIVGDRADYYYSKPMYKLLINCVTTNNGKFVAKLEKVYVE